MPIPVYTQDPPATSAAKADGITPKTAAPQSNAPVTAPATNPATTTAVPSEKSPSYPQAQPAHGIVPAPTNAYGHPTGPASNYTPLPPTPTPTQTTQQYDGPPSPQPGAVPVPPGGGASSTISNLPPPPKVGEKYVPPAPAPAQAPQLVRTMPPQFCYAPPNSTYQPATMSTVPSTTPSQTYGAPLSYHSPRVGGDNDRLDHPPGKLSTIAIIGLCTNST